MSGIAGHTFSVGPEEINEKIVEILASVQVLNTFTVQVEVIR